MDIIVDIDGTIADMRHRRHFIHGDKKPDWLRFFSAMIHDEPIVPMRETIDCLYECLHAIILCTGRPEQYRQLTIDWLNKHKFRRTYLYMRENSDNRADFIIKRDLLTKMRKDGLDPVLAFEDKQECVDMWRANGIITLQNSMKELP